MARFPNVKYGRVIGGNEIILVGEKADFKKIISVFEASLVINHLHN